MSWFSLIDILYYYLYDWSEQQWRIRARSETVLSEAQPRTILYLGIHFSSLAELAVCSRFTIPSAELKANCYYTFNRLTDQHVTSLFLFTSLCNAVPQFNCYQLQSQFKCLCMHVLVLPILSVCPSVNLSVQYRKCVKTNKHIVTCFWRLGRGIILVFWVLPPLQNSKGIKCTRGGKILQILPIISKTALDMSINGWPRMTEFGIWVSHVPIHMGWNVSVTNLLSVFL